MPASSPISTPVLPLRGMRARRIPATASLLRGAAALAVASLLVSCRSMRLAEPQRALPASDVPSSFAVSGPTVAMPDRWWEAFASEELNGLMERAFAGNLGLAQAWAQLRQARAAARSTAADGRLQIGANAAASRTDARANDETTTARSHGLGLSISYEVDLWGRIAATTDAARLAAEATEQDAKATALSLSAQLASAWIAVQSHQAQLNLVESQIRVAKDYLDLLVERQRKGMSELVDVLQQRQDIASLESTAETLRESRAVARLRVAYLLGLPDDRSLVLAEDGLPALPPLPEPGLPTGLLARRPDIMGARLRLRAQERTVAASRAARLPGLTLTGTAGLQSGQLKELFDNWAANVAAGLAAPLVDGGRLAAREQEARAVLEQRVLAYRDAVLGAVLEVNEGLVRERWRQAYLARLRTEAAYADETLAETRQRYLKGKNDYLSVLTALTAKQRAERSLVAARAELLANRIELCAALGGGWMEALPPTPER